MQQQLKGTRTEQNLIAAFSGEAQARARYTFYADQAKKDGYEQIAAIFEDTANNERAHAEIWFKYLNNNEMPKTEHNLKDSQVIEAYESNNMYPEFEKIAREEGFEDIANHFQAAAKIEEAHEKRFKELLSNVEQKLVFSKNGDSVWMCRNCGNLVYGKEAPLACPVCQKPQAYFELQNTNY